ncbi:alpha/beta hydrolase [bacterium]|nr:alpha/beta hydrolase [bacterium]
MKNRESLILVFAVFWIASSVTGSIAELSEENPWEEIKKDASDAYDDCNSLSSTIGYLFSKVLEQAVGDRNIEGNQEYWKERYKSLKENNKLGQEIQSLEEVRMQLIQLKNCINDNNLSVISNVYATLEMIQAQIDMAYIPLTKPGLVTSEDGVELHYKVLGEGTSILLLSGGPGSSSSYLFPVAQELSKTYRCILLDQRGTGKSKLDVYDETTLSLNAFISDLETLRVHLGIDKWIVLGHSWGGRLAMAYAVSHPYCIRALVLVGSSGLVSYDYGPVLERNIEAQQEVDELESSVFWSNEYRMKLPYAFSEWLRAQTPAYMFNPTEALSMTELSTGVDAFNPALFLAMANLYIDVKMDEKVLLVNRLKQPMLVIQGEQDPMGASTAYKTYNVLTSIYPNGKEIAFIAECGHVPWIEQPKDFFGKLKSFLQKVSLQVSRVNQEDR